MHIFSIQGKLVFTVIFALLVGAGVYIVGDRLQLQTGPLAALSFAASLITSILLGYLLTRRIHLRIQALENGLLNLLDNEYSTSINTTGRDELDTVLHHYNALASRLRQERQRIFQRELLLDTVIQNSELALLLVDGSSRVVYCNHESSHLFQNATPLQGQKLQELLAAAPQSVRDMFTQTHNGLFRIDDDTGGDVYHFSTGTFALHSESHKLYLVKKLTREINRKEIETWKKVIRVISHEINNSLAPISSMAHTGSQLLAQQKTERLAEIFSTITERSTHLVTFIEQYIRLARLPTPNIQNVTWQPLVQRLQQHYPFQIAGELPAANIRADATQLEQALLNLLKNAHESGSDKADIQLRITVDGAVKISVLDRGKGLLPEALQNAQLPLYTTKPKGSGIGLALTREIAEAHGGKLTLSNRKLGGVEACITIGL